MNAVECVLGEDYICERCGKEYRSRRRPPSQCHRACVIAPEPPVARIPLGPCAHRGAALREVKCRLCGPEKGKMVAVFACALHGECTLRPYAAGQKIKDCSRCGDASRSPSAGG